MTVIRPQGNFLVDELRRCCSWSMTGPVVIDLVGCNFVRPAGLVAMGVAMQQAVTQGRAVTLEFAEGSDLARYMDRMGMGDLAFRCGAVGSSFPVVSRHPAVDRFLELTRFDASGDSIIEDVCQTLLANTAGVAVDRQRLYNTIFELGVNVEHHAQSAGLVAVQNYPQLQRVEFAVGDFGVGIRGSLADAGFVYESDVEAIRNAVETDVSRTGDSGRGRGLPGLLGQVCGPLLRGDLIVQSGWGWVHFRRGRATVVSQLGSAAPGTMAFGSFQTR